MKWDFVRSPADTQPTLQLKATFLNTQPTLQSKATFLNTLTCFDSPPEKVQGLPAAGRVGLHPQQQDVRHCAPPADAGGGHRIGAGRRDVGNIDEGQR